MPINIGAGISATVKSLALSALSKSDTLNSLVNRITSGRVNRDTLAQSAFRDGLRAGASWVGTWEQFGDRAQSVGKHVETFLLAKSEKDVQEAFKGLMQELLVPQLPTVAHPLWGELLSESVGLAGDIAGALVEEKGLERTLATMVHKHGREVLADRLQVMLGESAMGEFAHKRLMEILDNGVLNNPEYVKENNSKYGYTADLLYMKFSGGDTKPLEDRAVSLLKSAPEGAKSVLDFVRGMMPENQWVNDGAGLLEALSENQPIEKVLATMAHAHPESKQELLSQVKTNFGKVFANILDRAILSNEALVQKDSETYGYLADTLHAGLTGDTKPLKDRTITLVTKVYENNAPQMFQSGVSTAYSVTMKTVSGVNQMVQGAYATADWLTGGWLSTPSTTNPPSEEIKEEGHSLEDISIPQKEVSADGTADAAPGWKDFLLKEQAFEKVLATMSDAHGKDHALGFVRGQVTHITGNARMGDIIATILDDKILSNEAYVVRDDQRYGFMADMLHAGLTGETKPLKDRTLQLAQKTYEEKTPQKIQNGISTVYSVATSTVSALNQAAGYGAEIVDSGAKLAQKTYEDYTPQIIQDAMSTTYSATLSAVNQAAGYGAEIVDSATKLTESGVNQLLQGAYAAADWLMGGWLSGSSNAGPPAGEVMATENRSV